MRTHFDALLQRDIDRIERKVLEMAALAEGALRLSLQALVEQNRQIAYSVILRDQYIDECEKELDRLCLEFLVRQQPAAANLRFVYSAIKINSQIERVGDSAEGIARQVLKVSRTPPLPSYDMYERLAQIAIRMFHDAITSFVERDAALARVTVKDEVTADDIRSEINDELLRLQQAGALPLKKLSPYMNIARRYERVADQAENICEEVLFACTGEYMKHRGTEVVRMLFVDEYNACRSQMAEGIAQSLGLGEFMFASAGLEPRPVDPGTVSFMAEKGIDISHQTSRSVDSVPNLEHYQVMVALCREAQRAFPPAPARTIGLEWQIGDPSRVSGEPDEVKAAYEETFDYIQTHIKDLVTAIVGERFTGKEQS